MRQKEEISGEKALGEPIGVMDSKAEECTKYNSSFINTYFYYSAFPCILPFESLHYDFVALEKKNVYFGINFTTL
jgi:hypothetical protein